MRYVRTRDAATSVHRVVSLAGMVDWRLAKDSDHRRDKASRALCCTFVASSESTSEAAIAPETHGISFRSTVGS